MPHALAGVGVEGHQALREEVVAEPLPAVVDVGGVADGQEHEPARLVDGHPGPDVGGPHVAPRLVLPRPAAELAFLGDGVEAPDEGAGAGVVGADVAGRRPSVDDAVADGAADDDEVLVHDRCRVELEVAAVDGPDEVAAQVDHAVVAERRHHFAGRRVEAEQAVPAREEDAQVPAVAPHGDAAVPEAAAEGGHAVGVGAGVEDPAFGPGLGVEGGDAVVVGADVDGAVEHDRRARERAGDGAELPPRPVRGPPRPRRLEPVDGVRGQGVGGRVAGVRGVAAHVRPFHRRAGGGRLPGPMPPARSPGGTGAPRRTRSRAAVFEGRVRSSVLLVREPAACPRRLPAGTVRAASGASRDDFPIGRRRRVGIHPGGNALGVHRRRISAPRR